MLAKNSRDEVFYYPYVGSLGAQMPMFDSGKFNRLAWNLRRRNCRNDDQIRRYESVCKGRNFIQRNVPGQPHHETNAVRKSQHWISKSWNKRWIESRNSKWDAQNWENYDERRSSGHCKWSSSSSCNCFTRAIWLKFLR